MFLFFSATFNNPKKNKQNAHGAQACLGRMARRYVFCVGVLDSKDEWLDLGERRLDSVLPISSMDEHVIFVSGGDSAACSVVQKLKLKILQTNFNK